MSRFLVLTHTHSILLTSESPLVMNRVPQAPSPLFLPMAIIDRIPTKIVTPGGFFDNLPVEILGEIFVYCLPLMAEHFIIPSMHEAPLLLCLVCARWRRVAMSMPILWSSFSAQPFRVSNATTYLSSMKFFLGLSRPLPLSFDIYAADPEQGKLVKQSFPLFLSEVRRWRHVTLDFNDAMCEQFLAASLGHDSSLEVLCFDTFECTSKQARRVPAALKKFPRLRRLKIGRTSNVPLLELPWSQLTDVHLSTPIPLNECIDALNECSNIVNCRFFRLTPPRESIKPHNIILPSLTHLELCSTYDVGSLLVHLTCSALTYLSVNHILWDITRDSKAFREFLVRSTCKLENFRLLDENITEIDLIHYISAQAMDSLKVLELRGLGASIDTLTMLKSNTTGATVALMPLLETLQLDVEGVPDDLFCDVVASRFTSAEMSLLKRPASLKSVRVRFRWRDREISPEETDALCLGHVSDCKRFEELKGKGLHVVMHFGG